MKLLRANILIGWATAPCHIVTKSTENMSNGLLHYAVHSIIAEFKYYNQSIYEVIVEMSRIVNWTLISARCL